MDTNINNTKFSRFSVSDYVENNQDKVVLDKDYIGLLSRFHESPWDYGVLLILSDFMEENQNQEWSKDLLFQKRIDLIRNFNSLNKFDTDNDGRVNFEWRHHSPDGASFFKTFKFKKEPYGIELMTVYYSNVYLIGSISYITESLDYEICEFFYNLMVIERFEKLQVRLFKREYEDKNVS